MKKKLQFIFVPVSMPFLFGLAGCQPKFSFIKYLKDASPLNSAAISALAAAENIGLGDEYDAPFLMTREMISGLISTFGAYKSARHVEWI